MYINKRNVLGDIADLQKSSWFKTGANSENFCLRNQYIGRKEAVEIVRDLCIVKADPVQAIPIPDNATNGDIIKTAFPDAEININEKLGVSGTVFINFKKEITLISLEWWNAPYKGVN